MTTDDPVEASPCKLKNGNWGCKTQVQVSVGDTVRIVTRANKQWRAQITQVVWTDDQVWICETASEDSSAAGKSPAEASAKKPGSAQKPVQPAGQRSDAAGSTASMPGSNRDAPTDDLDAMADRAAEEEGSMDEIMNAMQEFERDR